MIVGDARCRRADEGRARDGAVGGLRQITVVGEPCSNPLEHLVSLQLLAATQVNSREANLLSVRNRESHALGWNVEKRMA